MSAQKSGRRTRDGYRRLPQRNGKLAEVKMPVKKPGPKKARSYKVRRERALVFALNVVRKYDLFDEIDAQNPYSLREVEMLR